MKTMTIRAVSLPLAAREQESLGCLYIVCSSAKCNNPQQAGLVTAVFPSPFLTTFSSSFILILLLHGLVMFLQLLLSLAFVLQVSLAKVFLESPELVRSIRTRAGAPTLQLRRGAESQERSIFARDAAIAFTAPSSTGE